MDDVFDDLESFDQLPSGVSILAATICSFLVSGGGWPSVILVGMAVYVAFVVVRAITYSELLRISSIILAVLPSLIVCILGVPAYLIWQGEYSVAIALFMFNLAVFFDALDFLLFPISKFVGTPLLAGSPGWTFVAICNRRAARYDIVLDWEQYYSHCSDEVEPDDLLWGVQIPGEAIVRISWGAFAMAVLVWPAVILGWIPGGVSVAAITSAGCFSACFLCYRVHRVRNNTE